MQFITLFKVLQHSVLGDTALLLIRLAVGVAFMYHGWSKIQHPMTWMGPDAGFPGVIQALAAVSEFGGGLAWIVGLLTPLASFGIACTMAVAVTKVAIIKGAPLVSASGGPSFELALAYLCIALVLMSLGPGRFSLDRLFFGKR